MGRGGERADDRGGIAGHRDDRRPRRRSGRCRHGPGRRGRPDARSTRAVAAAAAGRAHPSRDGAGGGAEAARGRARHRLDRPDRRPCRLRADHRRRRHGDRRRLCPDGRDLRIREAGAVDGRRDRGAGARAGRRGRGDRAVERALCDHGRQGRPGAARRLHRRDEAVAGNAARSLYHRRGGRGGRAAAGRGQPGLRPSRGQRPSRLQSAGRQGQLHRIVRGREPDRQRLRRADGALHAGAGRQVGGDPARRFPDRGGGEAAGRHDHGDERPGLRDAEPGGRAARAATTRSPRRSPPR